MSVAVVIPFRDRGDPDRQANLEMVHHELEAARLGQVLVVSDGRVDGPFNRSAAYNRGVAALPATVYVFHEADMLVPVQQLRAAVEDAATVPGLVVPFSTYHYLSRSDTRKVRAGQLNPYLAVPQRRMDDCRSVGAVNVVSGVTMRMVGCWDETFEGWGFDDRAMTWAFAVASGRGARFIPGVGVHLWHRPGWQAQTGFAGGTQVSEAERAATERNRTRYEAYRRVTSPQRVRELTAGARI